MTASSVRSRSSAPTGGRTNLSLQITSDGWHRAQLPARRIGVVVAATSGVLIVS